jgi:hypothetical protein
MTRKNKNKARSLYYRRFQWEQVESSDSTLEALMRTAHDNLKSSNARILGYSNGMLQGMDCRLRREDLLIHIAYYTPDQPASLVPTPSPTESVLNTTEENPPAGHNFMEGDLFILIRNNDVILCPSNLHENAATHYISWMLQNGASIDIDANRYAISAVANLDMVKLIQSEGVRTLSLGASLYAATLSYNKRKSIRHDKVESLKKFAFDLLGAEGDASLAEQKKFANLSAKVSLSFDSRKRGGEIAGEQITKTALDLVSNQEDDNISIETRKGTIISHDEIRVSERVYLPCSGNSVSKLDAWQAMVEYMKQLHSRGMLSQ